MKRVCWGRVMASTGSHLSEVLILPLLLLFEPLTILDAPSFRRFVLLFSWGSEALSLAQSHIGSL